MGMTTVVLQSIRDSLQAADKEQLQAADMEQGKTAGMITPGMTTGWFLADANREIKRRRHHRHKIPLSAGMACTVNTTNTDMVMLDMHIV